MKPLPKLNAYFGPHSGGPRYFVDRQAQGEPSRPQSFVIEGGVHRQPLSGPADLFVGLEQLSAKDWIAQLLRNNIGRNVRITFEELPTEVRPR